MTFDGYRCPVLYSKESADLGKANFLSFSTPWRSPLPKPWDAYQDSTDLWNEVIQETEFL
jgi:hypothetical protein